MIFVPWLRTVLSHLVIDCIRHFGRARWTNLGWSDRYWLDRAQAGTQEDLEDLDEGNAAVRDALTELRSDVAELNFRVFYEHSIEQRSMAEISLLLGVPIRQVRKRYGA